MARRHVIKTNRDQSGREFQKMSAQHPTNFHNDPTVMSVLATPAIQGRIIGAERLFKQASTDARQCCRTYFNIEAT